MTLTWSDDVRVSGYSVRGGRGGLVTLVTALLPVFTLHLYIRSHSILEREREIDGEGGRVNRDKEGEMERGGEGG